MRAFPILASLLLMTSTAGLSKAQSAPIRIWPGQAPGEKTALPPEAAVHSPGDRLVAGRPVIRLTNVSDPTLTVYRPPAAIDTGAAVLVCPGGGYHILAMDLEGTEVCDWLNSIGVTGVLLKYRVPRREGRPYQAAPLEDAQRAMGIIRSHAAEWGIDPARVGCLGFSAGGHLCASLCAGDGTRSYPRIDAQDDTSCLPNFQILGYPAYFLDDSLTHLVEPVRPSPRTPPTFMVMAEDDPIHVEDVYVYALALRQDKVPVEVHVFAKGGHGFGMRPTDNPATHWAGLAAGWLRINGFLGTRNAPKSP